MTEFDLARNAPDGDDAGDALNGAYEQIYEEDEWI